MEEAFKKFAKFGKSHSDGYTMTLFNADKWMQQAGVIDGKRITTTDTGICFRFHFKTRRVNFQDFEAYVEALANQKRIDSGEIKHKLMMCGTPKTNNTTQVESFGVAGRVTDTNKFTGVHKLRTETTGGSITLRNQIKKGITGSVKTLENRPPFWTGRGLKPYY